MNTTKNYIQFILLFVCTSIANMAFAQTFWVTSNADSGPGTVRQAITDLNNSVDVGNEIKVALAGNTTVALESELPAISKRVIFDGQDQLSPSRLILTANVPLNQVIVVSADNSILNKITINKIDLFSEAALLINADNCVVTQCNIENIQGVSVGTSPSLGNIIGIHVISSRLSIISNCVIDTFSNDSTLNTMYGIELTNSSELVTITNCTIRNLQGSNFGTDPQASTVVAGIHSDSSVTDLTIINVSIEAIGNNVDNGQAYGIFHEESGSSTSNTTITNCTIQAICSGVKTTIIADDARVAGIISTNVIGSISNNTIEHIASADSPDQSESGTTYGIFLHNNTECSSNTVSYISSGAALKASFSFGISITNPLDCSLNTVTNITTNDALISQAIGIFISSLVDASCDGNIINTVIGKTVAIGLGIFSVQRLEQGSSLSGNTIECIQSESSSFGILILFCKEMSLVLNSVQQVEASAGTAYGIALGSEDGTALSVSNTAITENVIKHIHGATEGIGIILLANALHNVILSNIICDVTTKGIGVPNSPVDANCSILRAFLLPNGDVRVRGLLSQVAFVNEQYTLQFFVNQCNTVPEAPRQIKEVLFFASSEPSPFDITFTPTSTVEKGQYITMTATLATEVLTQEFPNNNTSELSNTRRVRTDVDALCAFLVCNNGTGEGSCCIINK